MYIVEFILSTQDITVEIIKDSLCGIGENLEIWQESDALDARRRDFKIQIHTQDPAVVFDLCAQFGRIKSVKVNASQSSA